MFIGFFFHFCFDRRFNGTFSLPVLLLLLLSAPKSGVAFFNRIVVLRSMNPSLTNNSETITWRFKQQIQQVTKHDTDAKIARVILNLIQKKYDNNDNLTY